MQVASDRVDEIVSTLRSEIGDTRSGFNFGSSTLYSVSLSEEQLGYKPNTVDYKKEVGLNIHWRQQSLVHIGSHAVGSKFRGLIAIVVAFSSPTKTGLTSEQPFQVNYVEPPEDAERRFRPWLEKSLARALTLWRQSL
jgi:hypothetical protein